jgi:predicted RNA binding protein YcfA (HicA-like mRNA interferase family)
MTAEISEALLMLEKAPTEIERETAEAILSSVGYERIEDPDSLIVFRHPDWRTLHVLSKKRRYLPHSLVARIIRELRSHST